MVPMAYLAYAFKNKDKRASYQPPADPAGRFIELIGKPPEIKRPRPPYDSPVAWTKMMSLLDCHGRRCLYEALGGQGRPDGWTRRVETISLLFKLPSEERGKLWATIVSRVKGL